MGSTPTMLAGGTVKKFYFANFFLIFKKIQGKKSNSRGVLSTTEGGYNGGEAVTLSNESHYPH